MSWKDAPALGQPKPGGGWQDAPARGGPTIEAAQALNAQYNPGALDRTVQGLSGFNEGLANFIGAPVDIMNAGLGYGLSGVNKVLGTSLKPSEKPFFGSEAWKDTLRESYMTQPPTNDPTDQFIRRTAQSVGAAAPAAIATGGVAPALQVLAPSLVGGLGAATAKQYAPQYPMLETAADLLGTAGGALGLSKLNAGITNYQSARAAAKVPSRQIMKDVAGQMLDQAEALPVQATAAETTAIRDDLRNLAQKSGRITSGGQIADVPELKHALTYMDDAAGKPMTIADMRQAREAITGLAASTSPKDARAGVKMLRRFDDWMEGYAPQIKPANKIYSQAMKSETLDKAMEQAKLSSETSQGMSYARALHGEFKKLASDIIKNGGQGWTPAEIEAINAAARGSNTEKVLRALGKMRPGNAFGQLLALGGGGAGFAAGGPIGALIGASPAIGGYLAQQGSDMLAQSAAKYAEALTRGSGTVAPKVNAIMSAPLKASVASTAAANVARPGGLLGTIDTERDERRKKKKGR